MLLLEAIPTGPVDRFMLAVTGLIFMICYRRSANVAAISAILAGLLVHAINQNVLHFTPLYVLTDMATGVVIVASLRNGDRTIQATCWSIIVALHMLMIWQFLSMFTGGTLIKLVALLSTILCLPSGGGNRARNRTFKSDFQSAIPGSGRRVAIALRMAVDKVRSLQRSYGQN